MGRFRLLLVGLLIFLAQASPAWAQGPISGSAGVELLDEMPRRLLFTFEGRSSAGDLTEARLFFQPVGSSARVSEPVAFDAAADVALEHEWNMQTNGMPPGVRIESFWRLTDSAGNTFETEPQTFVALDPRIEWQTVEDEELAISWYDGGEAWGQEMFSTGKEALAQLEEELGADITRQVRLVAYRSNDDFRAAFPPQQDWIGGQAFPDLGVTVQIIGAGETGWMRTVLAHELSHLVFAQATEGAIASTPSWLDEGLAMYNEPDDLDIAGRDSASVVQDAAEADELLAFSQLQGNFGADGATVGLAYAQSETIVAYLIEDCGTDGFRRMVQILVDEDQTLDEALTTACGYDSRTLFNTWRQTLPNAPEVTESEAAPAEPDSEQTEPSGEAAPVQSNPLQGLLPLLMVALLCFVGILGFGILFVIARLARPAAR